MRTDPNPNQLQRIKALCVERVLIGEPVELIFLLPWAQNWIKQQEDTGNLSALQDLLDLGWVPIPFNLPSLRKHPSIAKLICQKYPQLRKSLTMSLEASNPENLNLMAELGILPTAKAKLEKRYCREPD